MTNFSQRELLRKMDLDIESCPLEFTGEEHLNASLAASNAANVDDMMKSFHETIYIFSSHEMSLFFLKFGSFKTSFRGKRTNCTSTKDGKWLPYSN